MYRTVADLAWDKPEPASAPPPPVGDKIIAALRAAMREPEWGAEGRGAGGICGAWELNYRGCDASSRALD